MSYQDWTPIIWNKKVNVDLKSIPSAINKKNQNQNINAINNTIKKIYHEDDKSNNPDIMPVIIDNNFAKLLQQKRLEKKISQEHLANALSIPVSIINQYEKGTGIRNGTYITKIKKYLGI